MPEYVTVVFNELHVESVYRGMYGWNDLIVDPYELPGYPSRYGAIVKCPEGKGQYQADRYTSLMFGSRVFETKEQAKAHLDSY